MDTALQSSKSGYLVGDKCTLADISSWGWVAVAGKPFSTAPLFICPCIRSLFADSFPKTKAGSGVDINEFPALKKWRDLLLTRPGLEKGRHVPSPHKALEQENLTEEQIAEAAKKNAGWIQAGMKADKK